MDNQQAAGKGPQAEIPVGGGAARRPETGEARHGVGGSAESNAAAERSKKEAAVQRTGCDGSWSSGRCGVASGAGNGSACLAEADGCTRRTDSLHRGAAVHQQQL